MQRALIPICSSQKFGSWKVSVAPTVLTRLIGAEKTLHVLMSLSYASSRHGAGQCERPGLTPRKDLPDHLQEDLQKVQERCPGIDDSLVIEGRPKSKLKAMKKHAQSKRSRLRKKEAVLVEEKIIADYTRSAEQSVQACALSEGDNEGNAEELPYLPPELWTEIFSRTHLLMCLGMRDLVAAHKILHSEYRRQLALKHCIATRNASDLQLLVFTMKVISPRDLLTMAASRAYVDVRLCEGDEDFKWLVKFGLGEWVGQNILKVLKEAVEMGQLDTVQRLLKEMAITDDDWMELVIFARDVSRSSGNKSCQDCWSEIRDISLIRLLEERSRSSRSEMYRRYAYPPVSFCTPRMTEVVDPYP